MNYEQITTITQEPIFLIVVAFIWISAIILYVLTGIFAKSSSSSGRYSKRFIQTPNFFWGLLILFLWNGLTLLFFIIFPIWAKLIPS